jgi:hypothetical protein
MCMYVVLVDALMCNYLLVNYQDQE